MKKLIQRWPLGFEAKNWHDLVTQVILILFIVLFIDVWASQSMQRWPDIWREPFAFITHFGLSDWVLIPSLTVMLIGLMVTLITPRGFCQRVARELTLLSSFVFAGVGLPGLVTALLKRIVGRVRPVEYDAVGAFHFQPILNDWTLQSFPSGHSATAMASALVIGFLVPRLFSVILPVALVTGVSRVVIGMHYPTDVVAGLLVGLFGVYAVRNFYAARRWLFSQRPDGTIRFRGMPFLRRSWRKLFHRAAA